MTGLGLTAERHDQLRMFLEDERRLEAEYPRVAEYFSASSGMSGTGDSQMDMSFDLRFLHFMTGGRSASANPYWDIVAESVVEHGGRRFVNGGHSHGSARLAFAQMILQATYAYAIPSPETIWWMSDFCGGRPIVELGAGRGYWAAQLSDAGLNVDAYELDPPDKVNNPSFSPAKGQQDVWYPVAGLDALRFGGRSGDVLFLCWPPGWGDTMASDVLAAFERAGGERLVFVGEPKGGKTGDDAFFDALADRWRLDSADPRFVSWWNLTDAAQGWVRR